MQCIKFWALAMHVCMTLLRIVPFDFPKEKTKSWSLSLRGSFSTLFLFKGFRRTRFQNSPKSRAAISDAWLLVFSSSVDAFRMDAPLLFPICIIKEVCGVLCIPCCMCGALCRGGSLVAIWRSPSSSTTCSMAAIVSTSSIPSVFATFSF